MCEPASSGPMARQKRVMSTTSPAVTARIQSVRQALGIGFQGGTYEHLFYVADVDARGSAVNGELHAALDASDFLAVFPLKAPGRARLVGIVQAAEDDPMISPGTT